MRGVKAIRSLLTIPRDDLELVQCQLAAFSKHVPMLYGIVTANALLLAFTHLGSAPVFLSVVVPGLLTVVCFIRVIVWLRRVGRIVSDAEAVAQLQTTMWLVAVLGVIFTAWSLSLYPYGDLYAHFHVLFYMAVTVISCMFCLMHISRAALLLTALTVVPFTVFFCATGNVVFVAVAMNLVLVLAGLIFIMLRNYADFAALITSRRELLVRQIETKRLSDENFRLANLDSLTGLPNRRRFLSSLDRALTQAERSHTCFAVALIDLDGFKSINDTFGHAAGDRLLADVGDRLQRIAGPTVSLARLGGDEFGAILTGNPTQSDVAAFGRRLCALLNGAYLVAETTIQVSGSAGLVTYPAGGATGERLFERADYALYHAKQMRTGEPTIFSEEHETLIRRTSQIEQALRHADLDREMWLAYQPIVDVETGRIIGHEALARWRSPTMGVVGPDVFIPVAERARLIGNITATLLAKALRAASGWPATHCVSFNLSAQDLSSRQTMDVVRDLVVASGIAPGRIEFEITETAVMRDFDEALDSLAVLRRLGARIALDDFGTGYSSLSHVHRLKPDKIKIDRSFVTDVETNGTSRDIVRTIVDLCQYLRLDCVVEGVETEAQSRILTTLGCHLMQGYLFGRPAPMPELVGICADDRAGNAGPPAASPKNERDKRVIVAGYQALG